MAERITKMFGRHAGAEGIARKMAHSLASNTAKNYGGHFQRFVLWCEAEPDQPDPLPATTPTVIRWLENDVCVDGRVAEGSLQPYLSALNKVHEDLDFERPALGTLLKSYRNGLARLQNLNVSVSGSPITVLNFSRRT